MDQTPNDSPFSSGFTDSPNRLINPSRPSSPVYAADVGHTKCSKRPRDALCHLAGPNLICCDCIMRRRAPANRRRSQVVSIVEPFQRLLTNELTLFLLPLTTSLARYKSVRGVQIGANQSRLAAREPSAKGERNRGQPR